ncbi:hypothetical protein GCM10009628_00280 [Paeniglutamicibacter kerguelensis]
MKARAPRGITWDWPLFIYGLVMALPAALVIPTNPMAGLALALGVLPAAAFKLPGVRQERHTIIIVGVLCAVALQIGSLLTNVPAVAVPAIFVLAVLTSVWSRASRFGTLTLFLALPLTGIGLSIHSFGTAVILGGLMVAGSVYAWLVSLLWPERVPPTAPVPPPKLPLNTMFVYGTLLGLAAASAAAIGYLLDLEHVGWPTGAVLLVMRPARSQLVLRSIGRAASVLLGSLAAAAFAVFSTQGLGTALVVGVVVAAMAATTASRWYVTPGFASFIVLTFIMQADTTESPGDRFVERTMETLLGISLALLFGALIPAIIQRVRKVRTPV